MPESPSFHESSVGIVSREHILLEHGVGEITVLNETLWPDSPQIVVSGDIPENCVGAGEVDPRNDSGKVSTTQYRIGIKGGGGKVRVLKGDTGKISPAEVNGTGEVGEDGIGA